MTRHISSVSLYVVSKNVLKSHESFTHFTPNVFSRSYKLLIINALQEIVRVSFSAPNASQHTLRGVFVCAPKVLTKDLFEFHDIQHRKLRAVYEPIPRLVKMPIEPSLEGVSMASDALMDLIHRYPFRRNILE